MVLILEVNRWIILRMYKKFPQPKESKQRFWKTALFVFINTLLLILFTFYLSHFLRAMHTAPFYIAFSSVSVASLVLALVHTGVYAALYYSRRLRKVEQEKEELLRINLQSQYDSLKQQVNPHFLFNSINTVSSLISIDPEKARKFLAEMSKVYRYLLQNNEE